jgi:hypothetical protein
LPATHDRMDADDAGAIALAAAQKIAAARSF